MIDRPDLQAVATRVVHDVTGDARASAFRRLAGAQLDGAYRIARAIVGNPTDAQDAVHDAFVRAWQGWASLRDEERFEAWFGRILVNTCRNRLRSRSRARVTDISPDLELAASGDPFAPTREREDILRALASLDPDARAIVALRYYLDLTIDQIADRLGTPPGTIKSRLHRALRQLEAVLGADHEHGGSR